MTVLDPCLHAVSVPHEGQLFAFTSLRIDDAARVLVDGVPIGDAGRQGAAPRLAAMYVP